MGSYGDSRTCSLPSLAPSGRRTLSARATVPPMLWAGEVEVIPQIRDLGREPGGSMAGCGLLGGRPRGAAQPWRDLGRANRAVRRPGCDSGVRDTVFSIRPAEAEASRVHIDWIDEERGRARGAPRLRMHARLRYPASSMSSSTRHRVVAGVTALGSDARLALFDAEAIAELVKRTAHMTSVRLSADEHL